MGERLFGKVRASLLALFFCHSDQSFYFREIDRTLGVGRGAIQRELQNLVDAGLVARWRRGNQVFYRANRDAPLFQDIRSIMVKTAGVADALRRALKPLAPLIHAAFIYGSFARGAENAASDVDVLVVGDVAFAQVVDALADAQ
ncbi:MAG: winged helix-turn-helix domain-containing protein, partial [Desulfomonilaceae bacterium]